MKWIALASTLFSAVLAAEDASLANETTTNSSASSASCMDANVQGAAEQECYSNVQWAMGDGWVRHKTWYEEKGITSNSTFADYQCALYLMKGQGAKNGISHGCLRPCDSTMAACAETAMPGAVEPQGEKAPILPPYAIVLLVLVAVASAVALISTVFYGKKKKKGPSKTKRNVSTAVAADPAPAPAAPVIPTTAVTTAPAVYLQTVQAPNAGSFVYSAQPQVTYAMPAAQMALPTTASPVAYYTTQ